MHKTKYFVSELGHQFKQQNVHDAKIFLKYELCCFFARAGYVVWEADPSSKTPRT